VNIQAKGRITDARLIGHFIHFTSSLTFYV